MENTNLDKPIASFLNDFFKFYHFDGSNLFHLYLKDSDFDCF